MKRRIISPLCSAFIIPGLGQVINHQIKKGLILLAAVFFLFIAGIVKLALIINSLLLSPQAGPIEQENVIENLLKEDFSVLHILIVAFLIIWLYYVITLFTLCFCRP